MGGPSLVLLVPPYTGHGALLGACDSFLWGTWSGEALAWCQADPLPGLGQVFAIGLWSYLSRVHR